MFTAKQWDVTARGGAFRFGGGAPAVTRFDPACERALKRFAKPYRARVAALAYTDPALMDLVRAFPAVLFKLAVPGGTIVSDRMGQVAVTRVAEMVIAGAKLKAVAKEAGVPMWMRALPPEAFVKPIGKMPDGFVFRRAIGQMIPEGDVWPVRWLPCIEAGHAICDSTFAMWLAFNWPRKEQCWLRGWKPEQIVPIGMYVWYGENDPVQLVGHDRWQVGMGVSKACGNAANWYDDVLVRVWMGNGSAYPAWHYGGRCLPNAGGFTIAPVATADAVIDEGSVMKHCVRDYADAIASGRSQIWTVQDAGTRVATVEVCRFGEAFVIEQIYGPENGYVSQEVVDFVYRWFLDQRDGVAMTKPEPNGCELDRAAWTAFGKPYWRAKGVPRFLPLKPSANALYGLRSGAYAMRSVYQDGGRS